MLDPMDPMDLWRRVAWREGFAPLLSTPGLKALRQALTSDDARLLQGATTAPPRPPGRQDCPAKAACAVGYCGWLGDGLTTVAEVEKYFARMCLEVDQRLGIEVDQRPGKEAGCQWFLNWYDETPRGEMRRLLLAEVNRALAQRRSEERRGR